MAEKIDAREASVVEVIDYDEKAIGTESAYEHQLSTMVTGVHAYDRIQTPWHGPRPFQFIKASKYIGGILLRGMIHPILMWRLPIVIWSGVVMGIYQIFFNCMAALSSGVLSAPPYNLSPNSVGPTFLSPFLAIVPGAIVGGWACDRWTVYCARKNGGISEAEHKLWLMIVPTILSPIGLLMMGLGIYYERHWMVFVAGEFMLTVAGPLATLISLTYAYDSLHSIHPKEKVGARAEVQQATPFFLSVVFLCMIMTFGFNYAIPPWAFTWGFKNFAISATCIANLINTSSFVMLKFGKRTRGSCAPYYQKIINW